VRPHASFSSDVEIVRFALEIVAADRIAVLLVRTDLGVHLDLDEVGRHPVVIAGLPWHVPQPCRACRESKLASVEQNGPLPVTHPEKDWKKAATGHGAAGAIPKEALDDMEKKSAPGAMVKTEP